MAADQEVRLSDEQRDALTNELFARQEAADPGKHRCFCGSDRDLINAVQTARAQADRERE